MMTFIHEIVIAYVDKLALGELSLSPVSIFPRVLIFFSYTENGM